MSRTSRQNRVFLSTVGCWAAAARAAGLAMVGLVGCGEGGVEPIERTESVEFSVELGTWDAEQGVFYELAPRQQVEVVMGFQGLVFVNLALLTAEPIPARFRAEGEVRFSSGRAPFPFYDNQVLFESLDGTSRLVPSLRLPFSEAVSELDGETIEIEVRLTSDDAWWCSSVMATVVLHDGDCEHTPGGEFVCAE